MNEMLWPIAASVGINLVIILFFYRALKRKSERFQRDHYDEGLDQFRGEIADLITDINHIVNGNMNVMEDKTLELKRLTNEANKRIMKLNSLITDAEIVRGRALGTSDRDLDHSIETTPSNGDGGSPNDGSHDGSAGKYERVFELYNLGLDVADIARRTNLGLPEVKLILGLNRDIRT